MKPLLFLLLAGCAFGQQGGTGITERQGKLITCPGDAGCPSVFVDPEKPGKVVAEPFLVNHDFHCVRITADLVEPNYDNPDCWPESKRPKTAWGDGQAGGSPLLGLDGTLTRNPFIVADPPERIDIPAIQETVASFPAFISNCNEGSNICMGGSGSCSHHGRFAQLRFESKCEGGWEWKCEDDNRGLIVSQNDKFATCHRVQP